jgi:hypothetical protein
MSAVHAPSGEFATAAASTTAAEIRTNRRLSTTAVLVALTLLLHLPAITRPLLGNFATRQVVNASIARNWIEGRATWYQPRLDELTGGERGLLLVEFPAIAYMAGTAWWAFGGELDLWARLTALAGWLIAVVFCHRWLLARAGPDVAFGGTLGLVLMPIGLAQGHAFQAEGQLLAASFVALWSWDRWLGAERNDSRRGLWLGLAALSLGWAVLGKVYMVVLALPLLVTLWQHAGPERRHPLVHLLGIASLVPAALWYGYLYTAPLGYWGVDPETVYYSVRQSTQDNGFPHPLLRSPAFYRDLVDLVALRVLTPVGLTLAVLGLTTPEGRRAWPWLIVLAVLVVALPRKFTELIYYWLVVMPPLCLWMGLGWRQLVRRTPSVQPAVAVGLVWLVLSLRFGLAAAYTDHFEDRGVLPAAAAIQALTEAEEPILVLHGTAPDLLYYCNRPGHLWPARIDDPAALLADHAQSGVRYFVVADLDWLADRVALVDALADAPIIAQGDDWRIYRLGN